jgi:putative hydrolase of the HAD superfamily
VLDFLDSRQKKLGVVSNTSFSSRILRRELEMHQLLRYFDFVVASADYGVRKPHPLIFSVAIKKMQLDPSEIWFIGNSIDHDVAGANTAGLFSVWYNRLGEESDSHRPDLEVKSWFEFQSILKNLVEHQS